VLEKTYPAWSKQGLLAHSFHFKTDRINVFELVTLLAVCDQVSRGAMVQR